MSYIADHQTPEEKERAEAYNLAYNQGIETYKQRLCAEVILLQGKYLPNSNMYSPEKINALEDVLTLIDETP